MTSREHKGMIIYNITVNVEEGIADDWLSWMKSTHIPKTLETGFFEGHKVLRLVNESADVPGLTYAVQYFVNDMKTLTQFASKHDPLLQQEVFERYGEKVVYFKTLLEEV